MVSGMASGGIHRKHARRRVEIAAEGLGYGLLAVGYVHAAIVPRGILARTLRRDDPEPPCRPFELESDRQLTLYSHHPSAHRAKVFSAPLGTGLSVNDLLQMGHQPIEHYRAPLVIESPGPGEV